MFSLLKLLKKKEKKKYIIDDYDQGISIQYKMVDLDIAMENIKAYYSDLNEKNKDILKKLITMAEYFRDWACSVGNFHHDDMKISHVYKEDSLRNPEVTLNIKVNETQGFGLIMGFEETYKRNCNALADFVYKRQKEDANATQKSFEELKNTLDKGKQKIEIDLDFLLKRFKETHFVTKNYGEYGFTSNDNADESNFCRVLYDALIEKVGKDELIEILRNGEDSL